MEKKLRVLIVEDLSTDVELAERELRTVLKNYTVQVVDTEEEFEQALETFKPGLIISDYQMPVFNGLSALKIKQEKSPLTPFVILTGSLNEDTAVECMKEGADDYVIKEHIKRLGPAVLKALEKKRIEKERKWAEEELRKLSTAVEQSPSVIVITDFKGNMEYVNPKFTKLTGYTSEEAIGQKPRILKSGELPDELYKELWDTISSGKEWHGEFHNKKKNGELFWEAASVSPIFDKQGKITNYIKVAEDITERKQAEEQIKYQLERLEALHNIDMLITSSTDLKVTLNTLLSQVTSQLDVDAATVLLLNPQTLTLEYVTGHGFRSTALQQTILHLGEGYAGRAALERRNINIANLAEEDSFSRSPLIKQEEFIAYYGVPLMAKGQVKGVLEIFHRAPLNPDHNWLDFLNTMATQTAIAIDNATLFDSLQRSNIELALAYDNTLEGWARTLELRDIETEGHSQRVTEMTMQLARIMCIGNEEIVHIRRGALLHDIGKMGIPDDILLKPGPLTENEWEIMRKHPVYAHDMLLKIPFLRPAMDIPYSHHEKWDGTGYPRGLKEEQIPLPARIFAIVDVWDALNSDRPYRKAWPKKKILKYIRDQAGKHFDPQIVDVFWKIIKDSTEATTGEKPSD